MHFSNYIITFFILFSLIGIASAETITVDSDLQTALDNAESGDTIIIKEGTYSIEHTLVSSGKDLTIKGEGATLYINTGSSPGMTIGGEYISSSTLSNSAKIGSSEVALSDASEVHAEDLIRIYNDDKWCPLDYPTQTTGELYMVKSVSGNTVTLNEPLIRDYDTSDTQVEIFKPAEIHISGITFQNQDGEGVREGLKLQYCVDSSVTDCIFRDNGQASLRVVTSWNVEVSGNKIYNSAHKGNGYGVGVSDASAFVTIKNNHIENCRHCIMSGTGDFKALNRGIVITKNTLIGGDLTGAHVIDSHPMTIDYLVTKNKIYPKPDYVAFYDGTLQSEFSDNEIYGGYGIVQRRGSVNGGVHIISENYAEKCGYAYGGTGYGVGNSLVIEKNEMVEGDYWYIFRLNTESIRNIKISENVFDGMDGVGIDIVQLIDDINVEVSKNSFENIKGTAINIDANSNNPGETIISDNSFSDVADDVVLKGVSAREDGAIDVDSGNSRNWKDLLNVVEVTGCDGEGDQEQINNALTNATDGSTVFLPAGEYWVDGSINFASAGVTLKGESGTIIRVSKTDRQWFSGFNGIIKSEYSDTSIENIEIDGNCDELDNSLANSRSDTRHDCERAIVVQGSSGNFVKNIVIKNVQVENCFSDGVHVRFAENVQVLNSVFSNCQHDSIYFVCVRNGLIKNTKIAGVTADCIRFDNCEKCKATNNTLFSYSGGNENGAYLHGENGFQIGDQGYSYGGGSDKSHIITTNNIEICDNKIINCGLEAILLDAAGKGDYENIYIHDNEIIGDEEFETSGVPVEILEEIEDVREGKSPSVETSKRVFNSIFDLLYYKEYLVQYTGNLTVILPDGVTESPSKVSGTIEYYKVGDNYTTFVNVPTEGLSAIQYEVSGVKTTHTLMLGERTVKGIMFTETSIWEGGLAHEVDALKLPGMVQKEEIKVTCVTPTSKFEPDLKTITTEFKPVKFNPFTIGLFFIVIIAWRFIRMSLKHLL